ncbi:MAG TPA: A/G-specific adenine glycosylase [Desulfobacteria bacterium]|nr:A/G-specific adenine glycosylase [Desulfobacteria bacterium]
MDSEERAQAERAFIRDFEQQIREKNLSSDARHAFRAIIYDHYRTDGRKLPWRETDDPYHILVSEIMLQQTQVERVIGKYDAFVTAFPDFHALAQAPLQEILKVWQGLGYNRRAIALKKSAEIVVSTYNGTLPSQQEELLTFPGIGRYTAAALATFAFHQPSVFIETNIRTVFIHFFFHDQDDIKDTEILPLVEQTLDTANPRQWYYALMDYGAMLKQQHPNPNRRSAHYHKQSAFKGSNRELRGMILRALTRESNLSERELVQTLKMDRERVKSALGQLHGEGFIKRSGNRYRIA